MATEVDPNHALDDTNSVHMITWFAPDRPVEGCTVYRLPDTEDPEA
jgi:hypothetical protein